MLLSSTLDTACCSLPQVAVFTSPEREHARTCVYIISTYMCTYRICAFMCICTCTSTHSCASVHAQVYPCIHIHLHMNIQKNAAIYMSPERMQAKPYSYAADVWALGIITTECAVGRLQPTPQTPYLQPNSHPQLQNQPSEQL